MNPAINLGLKNMDDLLRLEKISKDFGKLRALENVSFTIRPGEVVGLIGPNGAGKTTLFNVITGFYRPTFGKVFLKGRDVTHLPPDRLAKMGTVRTFQIPRPFKELSVYDNVAMGTLFNPGKIKELHVSTREFVDNILKSVMLIPWKESLSSTLGYGNLKLLELGRAQGAMPDLLLLDEPFAGLSTTEIDGITKVLLSLVEQGMTLIIVEHKLRELMRLVKRVIVLHYGKMIADGTPEDISKNDHVLKAYLGKRWVEFHA